MECPVCKKEFNEHTGRRPKRFCSESCKVKFFNAKKTVQKNNQPENKKEVEKQITTVVEPKVIQMRNETQPVAETDCIPPMPTRNPGEDAFDFAARKNEWKKLYGNN